MASTARSPRTSSLSREEVVSAALQMIDEQGMHALTMRSLGAQLGVEGMALYRHVSGREDLLEAVAHRVLDGLLEALDPRLTASWQGYLQNMAHAVRDKALAHPLAFPLVATRHPAATWLRPPLRSLSVVEHFLATLSQHGFDDKQVATTYQAFTSFLLGQLLLECGQHGAKAGPLDEPVDEGNATIPHADGQTGVTDFPVILRMRSLLSQDTSELQFEVALETLIDRLELSWSQ